MILSILFAAHALFAAMASLTPLLAVLLPLTSPLAWMPAVPRTLTLFASLPPPPSLAPTPSLASSAAVLLATLLMSAECAPSVLLATTLPMPVLALSPAAPVAATSASALVISPLPFPPSSACALLATLVILA